MAKRRASWCRIFRLPRAVHGVLANLSRSEARKFRRDWRRFEAIAIKRGLKSLSTQTTTRRPDGALASQPLHREHKGIEPVLSEVMRRRLDEQSLKMNTPEARELFRLAFEATPEEMGKAAVEAARERKERGLPPP